MLITPSLKTLSLALVAAVAIGLAACDSKDKSSGGGGNVPAPANPTPTVPPTASPTATPTPTPIPTPTPTPTPTPSGDFAVYNDANVLLANPDVLLFTSPSLSLNELSGGAAEGNSYLRTITGAGGFWGITVDKDNSGNTENLSAYSSGSLKFSLRMNRALTAADRIFINTGDGSGANSTYTLPNGTFGAGDVNVWKEISIPIATYSINKSAVKVPFAIAIDAAGSSLTFDIDNIRWVK